MRRASTVRFALYALCLIALLYTGYSILAGKPPQNNAAAAQMADKVANVADKVAYVHLEDVIEVPAGEVASPEILYKNFMNEKPFSPVVIFSKSYCGYSKAAKSLLLEQYTLTPPPRVVELDQHPQGSELQAYIASVTGRRTVPNVIVMKESRGGASDVIALHEAGTLMSNLLEWGKGHLKVSKN